MANDAFLSNQYLVIDVSGGPEATNYPVTYLSSQPVLEDEHKQTKIVLRQIPAGSFIMGSPSNEIARGSDEQQHTVTLTKAFYMGIYEITQAQYSNVMGNNPSTFKQGTHTPRRPVENVSWNIVRGGTWPGGSPAGTTFMGKLRSKTGLAFDLPTEAQWEYACRAGTTGAWNNGTTITNGMSDGNLDMLGRYRNNGGYTTSVVDQTYYNTAEVGSYQVNNCGLYDMHGNVMEWCLDWYGNYTGDATDPNGPVSGSGRILRGGSRYNTAKNGRSAPGTPTTARTSPTATSASGFSCPQVSRAERLRRPSGTPAFWCRGAIE
jgi:formylglycine-generating enzyme required for sulfatase activity